MNLSLSDAMFMVSGKAKLPIENVVNRGKEQDLSFANIGSIFRRTVLRIVGTCDVDRSREFKTTSVISKKREHRGQG